MSRLNLVVADSDEAYLESLVSFMISNHSNRFQVNSFSKKEFLVTFLESTDRRIDILLIAPELYCEDIKKANINTIIHLSSGRISSEIHEINTVNKYQHAERLVNKILKIFSDSETNECFFSNNSRKTKVIAVCSPAGGTGKTTIAVNMSVQSAARGIPVFYLNLENIPSTSLYFNSNNESSFSEILFYLKEKKANLTMRIEGLRSIDESKVHFFNSQENIFELNEMLPEELILLINQLKSLRFYEVIFIDMCSGFDKHTEALFDICDSIIMVLDPKDTSATKMKLLEKSLAKISDKRNLDISGKIRIIINKSFSGAINQLDSFVFDKEYKSTCLPFVSDIQPNKPDNGPGFNLGVNQLLEDVLDISKQYSSFSSKERVLI